LFINGEFIKEYGVGLGKDNKTPVGTFVIDRMLVNPDWYPPEGGVIKYGEKGHLIGDRWLGFKDLPGLVGFGIHGTNEPASIGTLCSNGCIRLLNEEAIELFDFVTPGTMVTIVE
jgi:lipoprotein-anchoring transpeptidase ErfK/SrfK